jgi:hypothetical protein
MVVAAVLVLSLGLHWTLLQTIAWTGMFISFSRTGSFKEAAIKTFDGQHPCTLCTAIKQGREEERQQDREPWTGGSKLDPGVVWLSPELVFESAAESMDSTQAFRRSRTDEPPKPRPKDA